MISSSGYGMWKQRAQFLSNFSVHCSRLVLERVTLPLNRAELNEGGEARSEQRLGIFDPELRHFQVRDVLL